MKEKFNSYYLSIISKIYSIIIGVISSAFYVRYLGLTYKGIYSYINEIATISVLIFNLGIYQSYSYYYRKYGSSIYKPYIDIIIIQYSIYMIISVIGIIIFKNSYIIPMILLMIPINILKTQFDNIIIIENINMYLYFDILFKTILSLVYACLWLLFPVNLWYLVISTCVVNFVSCLVYIQKSKYKLRGFNVKLSMVKEILRFGFFPMLSSLLLTLNYSVDIIFLRHLGNSTELSLYSLAAVIMNYIWLIPNAFKDVLISKIARSESKNDLVFSTKFSLFFTLIAMIGFAVLGKFLLCIVFGKEFIGAYKPVMILFIGAFSMIFFKMFGIVFVTEGRRKSYFFILFISVTMNMLANYIFIPKFGMTGAAWASVISYSICGILFLFFYCKMKNEKMRNFIVINGADIRKIRQSLGK